MYDLEEDNYDASSTPLEQRLLHHRHQRLEHAAKPHRVVDVVVVVVVVLESALPSSGGTRVAFINTSTAATFP